MGIAGLLPKLKSVTKTVNLESYAGKIIGVDAFPLLYKGSYSCATELALGEPTLRYMDYFERRIKELIQFKIRPYVVFDGMKLSMKFKTNEKRFTLKKRKFEEGLAAHNDNVKRKMDEGSGASSSGDKETADACFKQSIFIKSPMVHTAIKYLRRNDVPFVVAPYEADAQLGYMCRKGIIDAVIATDSDMLLFGVNELILNSEKNSCTKSISIADIPNCQELAFYGLTHDQFIQIAVLSGCDYLDSIPSVGLARALKMVKLANGSTEALFNLIKTKYPESANTNYEDNFLKAVSLFKFQTVFDVERRELTNVLPLPKELENAKYLGKKIDTALACGIADGLVDPRSFEPYTDDLINSSYSNLSLGSKEEIKEPILRNIMPQFSQLYSSQRKCSFLFGQ